MHHEEAKTARSPCVVEDLERDRRGADLGSVQPERGGEDVERPLHARAVDEDDGSAVRGRVVERRDARSSGEPVCAKADRPLVATKVDVLAREGGRPSELGDACLVARSPEVDGLAAHDDEIAVEVSDLSDPVGWALEPSATKYGRGRDGATAVARSPSIT